MPENLVCRRSQQLVPMVFLILSLVVCASIGCGRRNRYVPSASSGREALKAALTAWQNGQPVGTIKTVSPPVQAVDSGWSRGQTLAGYEILEEVTRSDGRRCFKVRLHLQNPAATQEVHYLVVGRSPLWIYREEDYKSAQGWEGY